MASTVPALPAHAHQFAGSTFSEPATGAPYGNAYTGLQPRHSRRDRVSPAPGAGYFLPDRTRGGGTGAGFGRCHAEGKRSGFGHGRLPVLHSLCRALVSFTRAGFSRA